MQVSPDGQGPTGHALLDGDGLAAGDDDDRPAGRDADLELDRRAARDRQRRRGDDSLVRPGQGHLLVLRGRGRTATSRAGPPGRNRLAGTAMSSAWWGRWWLYAWTQPSMAACAASSDSNGDTWSSSSARRLLWNRSIFPVVVGEPGLAVPQDDAVLPADPLKQHLDRLRPGVPAGELAAVVGQHLSRHP